MRCIDKIGHLFRKHVFLTSYPERNQVPIRESTNAFQFNVLKNPVEFHTLKVMGFIWQLDVR